MCEPAPGPRCSYDMGRKLATRTQTYQKALKTEPENSPSLQLLKAKQYIAQLEYDTTPAGIEELKTAQQQNPNDTRTNQRLIRAITSRQQQNIALHEIRNKRLQTLAQAYTHLAPNFDEEELASIIETSRDEQTQQYITQATQTATIPQETPENTRQQQYNNLITTLQNTKTIPPHIIKTLQTLPTPDTTTLKAYQNIPNTITQANQQLKQQLSLASTIQNTRPEIAQKFYKAYREQYKTLYANKTPGNQPNPPDNWIKGEFKNSGSAGNPNSKYAPHDKASMYAIHRLQADDKAIPDYMKQNRGYVELTQTETGETQIHTYTPNGKKIRTTPLINMGNLQEELQGKTLIHPTSRTPNTINTTDYIAKHFDYPKYTTKYVANQLGTPETEAELFFAAKKRTKIIWDSKTIRATAPIAKIDL